MEEYEELLKPIKDKFKRGEINDQEAIALLLKKLKISSEENNSEEFLKFKKLSRLLFQDEVCLDIGYKMPSGNNYNFFKASEHYAAVLFSIYKYLSGKDFNSEEELLELMKDSLKNKKILELGCGVGFNLKVLNNLGAKTSGIDILPELREKIEGIDLIIDDCENLQKIFDNGVFDIIYSMDFFTDSILTSDKSRKILRESFEILKPGGLIINHITYKKVDLPVILLSIWLFCEKTGKDYDSAEKEYFENNSQKLYSNNPTLTKEDYESHGFEVLKYCKEDGEFMVVARKLK